MEDEYQQTVERHKTGPKGKRGIDKLAEMCARLVAVTDETRADILGDLFQGAISYGEKGQFLTPECVCDMMAAMNLPSEKTGLEGRRSVNDPCCGSGRMLLAAAKLQPHWHFVGQDVDLRCVRMTAINLGLRNHHGHVVCGNSLGNIAGFCKSATREEIESHGHVLTPGRYVGAEETEDDDDMPFDERMEQLTAKLKGQFAESAGLEKAILKNLASLGFTGKVFRSWFVDFDPVHAKAALPPRQRLEPRDPKLTADSAIKVFRMSTDADRRNNLFALFAC